MMKKVFKLNNRTGEILYDDCFSSLSEESKYTCPVPDTFLYGHLSGVCFYCTSFSLKLLLLDLVLFPPRLILCQDQSKRNNFCEREAQVTRYARKVSFSYTELDLL
jgi:hypothetical protein